MKLFVNSIIQVLSMCKFSVVEAKIETEAFVLGYLK
jgi:hypothetical protein